MATVRVHGWAALGDSEPLAEARRSAAAGTVARGARRIARGFDDDPTIARESMVDVFATLGDGPVVAEYRPKLAARSVLIGGGEHMTDVHDRIREFWDRDAETYDRSASHAVSDPLGGGGVASRAARPRFPNRPPPSSMSGPAPARSACSRPSSGIG